jgi:hypothetical protein
MKSILSIILFFVSISTFAQKVKTSPPTAADKFPIPPASDVRLFYIQRTPNINTIVYDANMLVNKTLNKNSPVKVYWIRYAEHGQKEELSFIQRTVGFGIDTKAIANETNSYEGEVVSYKKRKFKITQDAKGVPIALFMINGKMNILQRVFINMEETGHLIPKVLNVELWGKDPRTGAEVYERFKP